MTMTRGVPCPVYPAGEFMAYSFTERKRIRKSFGSRENVIEIPYLLQMQKDAYTAFLQAEVHAGVAPAPLCNGLDTHCTPKPPD